jgi:hypothetical protein
VKIMGINTMGIGVWDVFNAVAAGTCTITAVSLLTMAQPELAAVAALAAGANLLAIFIKPSQPE